MNGWVDLDGLRVDEQLGLPDLVAAPKKLWADKARTSAESLAVTVAQAAVAGARDEAAALPKPDVVAPPAGMGYDLVEVPAYIERVWRSRDDERVRETHQQAEGADKAARCAVRRGSYSLRDPCDHCDALGPPSQTRWCRCWLRYEWPSGATFTLDPSRD